MKKKMVISIMVLMYCVLLFGCKTTETDKTKKTEETEETLSEDLVNDEFNGEVIVETITLSEDKEEGVYITWIDNDNNMINGYITQEVKGEYQYAIGDKLQINAIKDGTYKTLTGRECYRITSVSGGIKSEEDDNKANINEADLFHSLMWETSEDNINAMKNSYLYDNEYITIGQCLEEAASASFSNVNWKYAQDGDYEYLMADYFSNGYLYQVVFENNMDHKIIIKELYENEELQTEDDIWEFYDFTFAWRENVASYDAQGTDIVEDYDGSEEFTDEFIEEPFIPMLNCSKDYDTTYYSEESGIWLVGNTMINGKPFQISGIDYLYLEDGYLYFMGELNNMGDKPYKIDLSIALYDVNENLIDRITLGPKAFLYNEELEWERKTEDWTSENYRNFYLNVYSEIEEEEKRIEFFIPAGSNGKFTFLAFNNEYMINSFSSRIYDTYNLRDINQEIYYIYVTVSDYYNE